MIFGKEAIRKRLVENFVDIYVGNLQHTKLNPSQKEIISQSIVNPKQKQGLKVQLSF